MQVTGPKGPAPYGGSDMMTWARHQLGLAGQIMDNPGGGLLFASQTMGQVRAALEAADQHRWEPVVRLLAEVEDEAVHRNFAIAHASLQSAQDAFERISTQS